VGACFRRFGPVYLPLGANPMGHFCFFSETKPKPASLEPLNGFLAYLEPKSWLKNLIFDKNEKVTKKGMICLLSSGQNLPSHIATAG